MLQGEIFRPHDWIKSPRAFRKSRPNFLEWMLMRCDFDVLCLDEVSFFVVHKHFFANRTTESNLLAIYMAVSTSRLGAERVKLKQVALIWDISSLVTFPQNVRVVRQYELYLNRHTQNRSKEENERRTHLASSFFSFFSPFEKKANDFWKGTNFLPNEMTERAFSEGWLTQTSHLHLLSYTETLDTENESFLRMFSLLFLSSLAGHASITS